METPAGREMRNSPPGRGSASTTSANQLFMWVGSVRSAKTVSGGASIQISSRTSWSSSLICSPCFAAQLRRPASVVAVEGAKSFYIFNELVEAFVPQHIEALRSDPALVEEPGVAQDSNVLRDAGRVNLNRRAMVPAGISRSRTRFKILNRVSLLNA